MYATTDPKTLDRIRGAVHQVGWPDVSADVMSRILLYQDSVGLEGGSYAMSAALYVSLKELGLDPVLCIGECSSPTIRSFTHAWVSLDGRIIDLTACRLLDPVEPISGPVVGNWDMRDWRISSILYGDGVCDMDASGVAVLAMPFVEYMNGYPSGGDGLWSVVLAVMDGFATKLLCVDDYIDTQWKHIKNNMFGFFGG